MTDSKNPPKAFADPIMELIEEYSDVAFADNFVTHQISLSDVVKNDMKRQLDWDDNTINAKLWGVINSGLDKNGRYRWRPLEAAAEEPLKKYVATYVEAQCLLTEWLSIHRAIRVHCSSARKGRAA